MTKTWSMFVAAVILSSPLALHADAAAKVKIDGKEVTLARYAKAFIGEGNVRVEVAPYSMGDQDGAIILFHGIESDWDGKAINHRVALKNNNGEFDYVTHTKTGDWHTIVVRKPYGDSSDYELYVPGVKDGIALAPSDGAAQLASPADIVAEYHKQQSSKK